MDSLQITDMEIPSRPNLVIYSTAGTVYVTRLNHRRGTGMTQGYLAQVLWQL